ncbi:flagellar biosynthesis protein FlgA [Anaerosporomusa subterranea]|uniref:Flagellar P-ring protein n=1 Tax=Anaerosporomusa subterranea TaxID=1794912 RepID=A0A154BQR1_ANASB|nr:flagellar basal body P-ring protein FlgI [Anaerosporomusa subterranea]KYZ76353.1 flagellar biosynthesis protein FlgA [Anaerosporomusa subterranea]
MRKTVALCALLLITLMTGIVAAAPGVRVKDIARVQGARDNQLVGYGLVLGLSGSGDSDKSDFTVQSIANMLKSFGVIANMSQLQPKNAAAVMVTAKLPPFARPGDTIDITISSLGDAKSLQGGTLIQTPLKAANGQVYAVGQGPLSIGGFSVGAGGSRQMKNFQTVASIPGGAIVERDVSVQLVNNGSIALSLMQPDFTTASRISEAIDRRFGTISHARDAGSVVIDIPTGQSESLVAFIAAIEELPIQPDAAAKIIINERTGTVVMGSDVAISEVAVAQGGLTVKIVSEKQVSQPAPFSDGQTAVVNQTSIEVKEEPANLIVLPATAHVGDVVKALNAVGASPREIISILQAMKAAGALHAELTLM